MKNFSNKCLHLITSYLCIFLKQPVFLSYQNVFSLKLVVGENSLVGRIMLHINSERGQVLSLIICEYVTFKAKATLQMCLRY
jgi:hypothetical protein